jgi:hypothetical protein
MITDRAWSLVPISFDIEIDGFVLDPRESIARTAAKQLDVRIQCR